MLRAAVEDHKLAAVLPRRFIEALGKANFCHKELVDAAFPVGEQCGIYFLIRDFQVTYVGQTVRLFERLAQHKRRGRRFDSFSFIPCAAEHLDELEKTYITLLFPEENTTIGKQIDEKAPRSSVRA
ncbi:GIY-YIG nuclease family protein [Frateuria sp. GZRR35]|uniref:GIY-YIG nuclease family protein n=1 Tax=unclassified Frateuria TaxID=2648894 RepID=UPI003EDB790A